MACLREELTYTGRERVQPDLDERERDARRADSVRLLGDGRDAVLIISAASGLGGRFPDYERLFPQIGAGSLALTHIVFSDKGRYRIVDGPKLTEMSFYKFGRPIPGMEVIVAHAIWQPGEPHWGAHRYRFERHIWSGERYVRRPLGITKKKHSPTPQQEYRFVEAMLAAEPDVVTPSSR